MKSHPLTYCLTVTSLLISLIIGCNPYQPRTVIDISSVPPATPPKEPSQSPKSLQAEAELGKHLKHQGATMYAASWCGYCHKQLNLFGGEAAAILDKVECDPNGENSRPDLCRQNDVKAFPTWQINGQLYSGLRSLDELADLSGYQGSRSWE
jgi:glutaredoxin